MITKTREEMAAKLNSLLNGDTENVVKAGAGKWHFGCLELREFMDWMFDGPPKNAQETIDTPKRFGAWHN